MAVYYDTQGVNPQQVYSAPGNAPDQAPDQVPGQSFLGRMANVAGAMASLALVAGIGVWGYKLVMRDVSGIPVVRALEGPMRIQPENPGGNRADNQGLAVNRVAAKGTAAPPADRLVLAPRPVELAAEDKPMGQIEPLPVAAVGPGAAAAPDVPDETVADAAPGDDPTTAALRAGAVDRLVEQLLAGPAPHEAGNGQAVVQPAVAVGAMPRPEPAVLNDPGLERSARPRLRPVRAEPNAGSVAGAATGNGAASALDVDPGSVPAGARLAQLGAFDSPEVARAEWDRLNTRFEGYLDGKSRVIQKASSGGRTFYRLRAMGFEDIADARRFCSALLAENTDCIPVTAR